MKASERNLIVFAAHYQKFKVHTQPKENQHGSVQRLLIQKKERTTHKSFFREQNINQNKCESA